MMYKIQENIVDIKKERYAKIVPTRSTRNSHEKHIEIPFARTDTYKHSFFPKTSKVWNSLDGNIVKAPSIESFRRAL